MDHEGYPVPSTTLLDDDRNVDLFHGICIGARIASVIWSDTVDLSQRERERGNGKFDRRVRGERE